MVGRSRMNCGQDLYHLIEFAQPLRVVALLCFRAQMLNDLSTKAFFRGRRARHAVNTVSCGEEVGSYAGGKRVIVTGL